VNTASVRTDIERFDHRAIALNPNELHVVRAANASTNGPHAPTPQRSESTMARAKGPQIR